MVNNKRAKYNIYWDSAISFAIFVKILDNPGAIAMAISPIERANAQPSISRGATAFLFLFNNSFKIFMIFTF